MGAVTPTVTSIVTEKEILKAAKTETTKDIVRAMDMTMEMTKAV